MKKKNVKHFLALCGAAVILAACSAGGGEGDFSPVDVTGVSLSVDVLTLANGRSYTLTAAVSPASATNKRITWTSNETAIATVDAAGKVIALPALANGSAVITVTTADGNFTASCMVTDITRFEPYLKTLPANDADTPHSVAANVNLTINNWQNLLTGLTNAKRFVGLDLSACSGMTQFQPGADTANINGKSTIVSLVLPDSTTATAANTNIYGTFRFFTSLKEIKGNGISTLGNGSFVALTSLQRFSFPVLKTIGNEAFLSCSGLTGNLTIPNSVTNIGTSAFSGCSGLTSVTIPNSVTSIEQSAFNRCSGLTSVTIPDSVTSIGGGAFLSCSDLTSVTIPNSVTSIGESAFALCNGLTRVTFNCTISAANFSTGYYGTFPGDLRNKYLNGGGKGTYTSAGGTNPVWTKQP